MGNCLQYICPSSGEIKEQEVKEEQHAAETKLEKPEVLCEETGRSASCALPSIDVDLPVPTLGCECKSSAKSTERKDIKNQEKKNTETTDGAQDSVGLQRLFFQSSSDSSLQTCDGTKTEDIQKALALSTPRQLYKKAGDLPTPRQLYKNAGALKDKETENTNMKPEEKRKKSMRKKLHLPKIKMKARKKREKFVPFDDWITGRLALMPRGADDECDLAPKPLDVVHSQMPSRALKADGIFLAVHQNAPNERNSSSDEGLEKQEEEKTTDSSHPPSHQLPPRKKMQRSLIEEKDVAANERVEAPRTLDKEKNGGKMQTGGKRSSVHQKQPVPTIEEEDVISGLPLFEGCEVLESSQAVLFEVEDAGYLASGEESD